MLRRTPLILALLGCVLLTGSSLTGQVAVFQANGTVVPSPHLVAAFTPLAGGTANVSLLGAAAFTNAASYECAAVDTTNIQAVQWVPTAGNAFTLNGNLNDVISWICVGN